MATSKMMERVYRLTPAIGHKRACAEVAGLCYDRRSDSMVPFAALARELEERYESEMSVFASQGGQ